MDAVGAKSMMQADATLSVMRMDSRKCVSNRPTKELQPTVAPQIQRPVREPCTAATLLRLRFM